MKLTIGDLKELTDRRGKPLVRFSVTVVADDGDALWTSEGWRLTADPDILILPPTAGNFRWSYHRVSPRLKEMLLRALSSFEGVAKIVRESQQQVQTLKIAAPEELEGERELE